MPNKSFKELLLTGTIVFVVILIFFEFVALLRNGIAPSIFQPGDAVRVVLNDTVIRSGKPCRLNLAGFISPTGPNGQAKWYNANRWLFPTDRNIAVILKVDGSTGWRSESVLIKEPPDPKLLLCPQ